MPCAYGARPRFQDSTSFHKIQQSWFHDAHWYRFLGLSHSSDGNRQRFEIQPLVPYSSHQCYGLAYFGPWFRHNRSEGNSSRSTALDDLVSNLNHNDDEKHGCQTDPNMVSFSFYSQDHNFSSTKKVLYENKKKIRIPDSTAEHSNDTVHHKDS